MIRFYRSLPAWGVWIEIVMYMSKINGNPSLPAWGVWIEIGFLYRDRWIITVAPRMGSVD